MIRSQKHIAWEKELPPDDVRFLSQTIEPERWYPMETFERFGNAILRHNAGSSVDAVRLWGRLSVDALCQANPNLLAPGDPIETLNRFRVLRATYFDFDALEVPILIEGHAQLVIRYHMGTEAEEAASFQTIGFFEELLAHAGAREVVAAFQQRSWAGDPQTVIDLTWSAPNA